MARVKLATVWLAGCSGCHMSLLDMDEWLLELAQWAEIVYSPLVDAKEYPEGVDAVLVEGPSGRGHGQLTGRTSTNRAVNFDGPGSLIGRMVDVTVTEALTNSLRGELARALPEAA